MNKKKEELLNKLKQLEEDFNTQVADIKKQIKECDKKVFEPIKLGEKYYSILIEDETAYSEMTYLIRAVNAKNQESKEHSIKSRKLKLPSVSVNLGLSEENFKAFKEKAKINATLSVFSKDNLALEFYEATKKLTNSKVGGAWRKYFFNSWR